MDLAQTVILETTPDDIGKRIDVFLAASLADHTRSRIQQYIAQGLISVNAQAVTKRYRLRLGDAVACVIPPPVHYEAQAEAIPLDIVYEDDALIVINKPQGMVVHPAAGHYTGTVVNALLYHCGSTLSGINGVLRPGIVHRIDKDTSGLIVAAKTDKAHQGLAAQLAAHTMHRIYHGVVWHNITADRLTIDKPLGRHPENRLKRAVVPGGKPAVTHIAVTERFGRFTLIEARLETGRTHQIRAHMAYMRHPLLGDTVYGGASQPFGLTGQTLHAYALGFSHPESGEWLSFESPWPPYFAAVVEKLRDMA